jgi:hypothetical protein
MHFAVGSLHPGTTSALSEVINRTLEKLLMTTTPRVVKSPVEELPADLVQLQATIDALPIEYRSQLIPLVTRVVDSTRRRRRIMNLVQEALSQLRLDMKYLLFDLEATRRERDELRRQVEGDGE